MRRIGIGVVGLGLVFAAAFGSFKAGRARTWQAFGTILWRVETAESRIAVTFDDGPDGEHVGELLAALDGADARGTFFVIGRDAERHPDAIRALAAAGHEIGNHSWSHERMWFRSVSWMAREIDDTDRVLGDLGVPTSRWFRPPYCKKGLALPWLLHRRGRTTVTWDVEPESDAAVAANPDAIVAHVRAAVRPGSIVLLHPWGEARATTREALPLLLTALRADGWELVTVSALADP